MVHDAGKRTPPIADFTATASSPNPPGESGYATATCQAEAGPLAISPHFHEASFMPTFNLLLLAGDGIGPEVMVEVKRLLGFYAQKGIAEFRTEDDLVGGACYD